MKRRVLSLFMGIVMIGSIVGCGGSSSSTEGTTPTVSVDDMQEVTGYTYGADVTFYSEEPVVYPLMYSDHENYPYKEDWLLWKAIEEKTNVTFDMTIVARTDYDDKVSAMVNTGSAPYIIPKVYDSAPYEDGGQVIAISDWVQYMPNYQQCVEDWNLEEDLQQITTADGKYYRLPGLWESVAGGYSFVIRKDIFEAAGVDLSGEATWTTEEFFDAMLKVKEYTGSSTVWSDQFQFGAAMNILANAYGVRAGSSADGGDWGLKDGMKFDFTNEEFYFANSTEEYKEFLIYLNKLYTSGVLDPETFTQDSTQAQAKFFNGESYVLTSNYQILSDMIANNRIQDENAELYFLTTPSGPAGNVKVSSLNGRLENGIMISTTALEELGEEEFIKMLRFIDWLWYSEEGHALSQWGVEGETYTLDSNNEFVLNSDIYYNGINPDAEKKLNVDYGFGGGVFAYGGSVRIQLSKFSEGEKEWNERINANKVNQELQPPVLADERQKEDMNLIKVPLMDYVNTAALEFIVGRRDIEADWDAYVAECDSKGSTRYVQMANDIFEETKSALGF